MIIYYNVVKFVKYYKLAIFRFVKYYKLGILVV